MSITKKVLLIMLLLAFVFVGANYYIQKEIIFPAFSNIEEQHAKANIDRVEELLNETINQLNRINYDWSAWDDTYEFVESRDDGYIENNLMYSTFENLQINLVYFLNKEGKLIWGEVYDFTQEEPLISSDEYITNSLESLKPYIDSIDLNSHSDDQFSKGIFIHDNTPIAFSIRPILDSEGNGPYRGYIVQGMLIDDAMIEKFQNQIKIKFKLETLESSDISGAPSEQHSYLINEISDTSLEISKNYLSNDRPILTISTQVPRDITLNGLTSIRYALTTLFIIGIFSFVIFWIVIKASVLRPISDLTKQMLKISKNKDYALRSDINSQDEVGLLAKEFNHMLSIIESGNSELKEAYSRIKSDHEKLLKADAELHAANIKLEQLTVTDPLTGIANRRCFENKLSLEWSHLKRSGQYLSIVMIDIDYFKAYNDHYGHPAGDHCLKQVANILSGNTRRPKDIAARYGGEEFILILPDADIYGAQKVAENIQKNIELANIEHRTSKVAKSLTISIGIASVIPSDKNSIETLIHQADSALYQAKKNGRNSFEVAHDLDQANKTS